MSPRVVSGPARLVTTQALFLGSVVACAWNAGGSRVATVSDRHVVAVWDVSVGSAVKVFACDVPVRCAALCGWGTGEALCLANGDGALALAEIVEFDVSKDDAPKSSLVEDEAVVDDDDDESAPKRLRKHSDVADEELGDFEEAPARGPSRIPVASRRRRRGRGRRHVESRRSANDAAKIIENATRRGSDRATIPLRRKVAAAGRIFRGDGVGADVRKKRPARAR